MVHIPASSQISTARASQALCRRWRFLGWSQEATESSFQGNVIMVLCNNKKPLFKKTQGEETESTQTSSSGKWVIERNPQIPMLLDHKPALYT